MIPGQAIRNTSYAIVPSAIREIEIWRAAVLMLSRYAGDAEAKLAAEGDHAGAAADSGGSRPRIRDDVAHHSDLMSLGVPR
jgi:hypothetical protein